MKMQEELKALSDRSAARLELLGEQYVQALQSGDNGMAAVLQGQRSAAVAYAQALEDCRLIVRQHS
jgi:hypothetical protein